ncbi:transposase, partial [Ruegeria sp. HKCCD8929]|uniref:transposase n=1 Tax=Ruegeria sp. HKCCD8929 TaxID=2683006 RepID=UPI00353008F5
METPQREALQKYALDHTTGQSKETSCTLGGNHRSDYTGARALVNSLPSADWLLGDRGYDADWFREALNDRGIRPCIPARQSRDKPVR